VLYGEVRSLALPLLRGRRESTGKVSAFVILEKCGLPQVHMPNITLSRVEYEILEALNGTTKDNNQEQRRKSRGIAQCTNCRMRLMRLLRNLSIARGYNAVSRDTCGS
jgi:hypothetical protein